MRGRLAARGWGAGLGGSEVQALTGERRAGRAASPRKVRGMPTDAVGVVLPARCRFIDDPELAYVITRARQVRRLPAWLRPLLLQALPGVGCSCACPLRRRRRLPTLAHAPLSRPLAAAQDLRGPPPISPPFNPHPHCPLRCTTCGTSSLAATPTGLGKWR